MKRLVTTIILLSAMPAAMAALTSDRINYQGVLRDASGNPQDGAFDMTFRFFNASSGGDELLVDEHLAAGTGAVIVTDGVFSVELGGGNLSMGSGTGAVATLNDLFGEFTGTGVECNDSACLFLEIQVQSEILTPRIPVLPSGYALSSLMLDGRGAAEFLDTSATPQTKTGALTLDDDLFLNGNIEGGGHTLISGGQAYGHLGGATYVPNPPGPILTADPFFQAYVFIQPQHHMEFLSGNGEFIFVQPSLIETVRIDDSGLDFLNGRSLTLYGGEIRAGDSDIDDVRLVAGNSLDDGYIEINGNGDMEFRTGFDRFRFIGGPSLNPFTMSLTNTTTSNQWTFGGTQLFLKLGESSDDFVLVAGSFQVAGTKNFVQNHPEDGNLSVVYTALEGDEAGTYTRGSARLDEGVARVPLGETFRWVTNPDVGLTAHVTPRGEWADLYVESISTTELVVRSRDGSIDAAFDYLVNGLRLGYEEQSVIQDRRLESTIPDPESYDGLYENAPDRRPLNALSRFRQAHVDVWGEVPVESDEAAALREGAGMHRLDRPAIEPPAPSNHDSRKPMIEDDVPATENRLLDSTGEPASRTVREASVVSRKPEPPGELADIFTVIGEVEPGDLLVIDPSGSDALIRSRMEADPAVVGVAAGTVGTSITAAPGPGDGRVSKARVAFAGLATLKVDAGYGPILPGDLLTSSPTPGHAMRADTPIQGTVVGKALQPLSHGTGLVRALLMPR